MKNKHYQNSVWISLALFFLLLPAISHAQMDIDPSFDQNNIISDEELLNSGSMSLEDIKNFLKNNNSYLASYSTSNVFGDTKTAAEIIYDAVNNNYDCSDAVDELSDNPTQAEKEAKCRRIKTVNPKLLLTTLEKEMSLITINANDSSIPKRLNIAMGYACPDDGGCSSYYYGFGKQVNATAWQFWRYMIFPNRYNFKAGQSYVVKNTVDPYGVASTTVVTPQNQATAALYNYTPHVFNGNYNFFKLWKKFFPRVDRYFPDGSILKVGNNPTIWLIENGRKRAFTNYPAFISRFRPEQIVNVESADVEKFPDGENIKFANYSLVRTPDKTIYLLVDKNKRPFANLSAFKKIGFQESEIEDVTTEDLASYSVGDTIKATSTYVVGALLQDSKTGDIFYVENGKKAPVDKILLDTKFAGKKISKKTTKELAAFEDADPILLDDGALVKTSSFPTVYLISGGKKRPFTDRAVFDKYGYNDKNVITASSQFLYYYDMGDPIQ